VVRSIEIDHLERECLSAVVAHISKGDRKSDSSEGDGLLAWDHSIEWMWAIKELILGEP
jgi:hypothetical protein